MRRFLRSAFRGEQPLPPRRATCPAQAVPSGESNLPEQWRRRRNSLVLMKKHQKTCTQNSGNVCLASIGDNAFQGREDPGEEPRHSVVDQQFDGVVDGASIHFGGA